MSIRSDRAQFLDVVLRNETIRVLTDRLAELELPDSYLAAGCLCQTVWNHVSGFPLAHGIDDYDVLYCDLDDLSWDGEDRTITRCAVAFADLDVDVQVRNQARVHLWYPEKFGVPHKPLRSTREGIDNFLHCCSALDCARRPTATMCTPLSDSTMSSGWSSAPTTCTTCRGGTRRRPTGGGGLGPVSLSPHGIPRLGRAAGLLAVEQPNEDLGWTRLGSCRSLLARAQGTSVSTYKGNAGNLMQHWTLSELLVTAGKYAAGLSFIDAHAMAPLALERTDGDPRFSRVQEGLPGQESAYEQAWHRLAPNGGYPNSAAFVQRIWNGDFSLLLCEADRSTTVQLAPWLKRVRESARCRSATLFPDDWRKRFGTGLPSASEAGLAEGSLTLVSFDPYMYNRRQVTTPAKGNLYPGDVERALGGMSSVKGPLLIQLSTYDTNDNNAQRDVIASLDSILKPRAFDLCAVVRVGRKMMSLVYAREVSWSADLANLSDRFGSWFRP